MASITAGAADDVQSQMKTAGDSQLLSGVVMLGQPRERGAKGHPGGLQLRVTLQLQLGWQEGLLSRLCRGLSVGTGSFRPRLCPVAHGHAGVSIQQSQGREQLELGLLKGQAQ